MRHAVKGRKLGRTTSHRTALFRNQIRSLIENERIITTLPKAKELRPIAEKVITHGKSGTLSDRRWVGRWIPNVKSLTKKERADGKLDLMQKLFGDLAERFRERPGGYLRIVKLGPRAGDGAEMAVLELVDRGEAAAPEPASEPKKGKAKKAAPAEKKESKPAKKAATPKKPKKAATAETEVAEEPKPKARKTRKKADKAE